MHDTAKSFEGSTELLHLSISVARIEQLDRNFTLFLAEKVAHKRDKKAQNGSIMQIRTYNCIR